MYNPNEDSFHAPYPNHNVNLTYKNLILVENHKIPLHNHPSCYCGIFPDQFQYNLALTAVQSIFSTGK